MPYTVYQFGTLVLPEYNPRDDVGTGQYLAAYRSLPGGGVFRPAGRQRAHRDATPLSKEVTIEAANAAAFVAAYRALRAYGGTVYRLWRLWDDGAHEWCWAELAEIPALREPGDTLHQPLTLNWTMISAYWHGTYHGGAWLIDDPEEMVLGDGHVLGADETVIITSSPQTIPVTNNGNRPVEDPVLWITAGNANITALEIRCGYGDLLFAGTIAAGNALMIDGSNWTVENNGSDAFNSLTFGAYHKSDQLITFEPGANTLTLTLTGGGAGSTFLAEFYDAHE